MCGPTSGQAHGALLLYVCISNTLQTMTSFSARPVFWLLPSHSSSLLGFHHFCLVLIFQYFPSNPACVLFVLFIPTFLSCNQKLALPFFIYLCKAVIPTRLPRRLLLSPKWVILGLDVRLSLS